jgi:hypothetical protein
MIGAELAKLGRGRLPKPIYDDQDADESGKNNGDVAKTTSMPPRKPPRP